MSEERPILLQAERLSRRDGGTARLSGLDMKLQQDEVLGLLGVNGSGKSTTLALLSGALAPSSGRVTVMGRDLHRQPRLARRHIGLLPEQPPLYPALTLDENLAFAARLQGLSKTEALAARRRVKRQMGLASIERRLCGRLSRGQALRAGIAQALIHRPNILILDEPTAGLDPAQAEELRELIRELAPGRGVILASHILLDVERLCSQVAVLNEGRLVADQTLRHSATARVRLLSPPQTAAELAGLPGVRSAQREAEGWYRLTTDNPPEDLAEQIAARHWGLAAFIPGCSDLHQWLTQLMTDGAAATDRSATTAEEDAA